MSLQDFLAAKGTGQSDKAAPTQATPASPTAPPSTTGGLSSFLAARSGSQGPSEKKPFIERKGLIQTIFKAPIELGKDIARLTPDYKAAQESEANLKKMADTIQESGASEDTKKLVGSYFEQDGKLLEESFPKKSTKQYLGDVAGTLLWALPIGELFEVGKGMTALNALSRGAGINATFGAADALAENKSFKDSVTEVATDAALGGIGELGLVGAGKVAQAVGKPLYEIMAKGYDKYFPDFLRSGMSRLKLSAGYAGEVLGRDLATVGEKASKATGGDWAAFVKSGLDDKEIDGKKLMRAAEKTGEFKGLTDENIVKNLSPKETQLLAEWKAYNDQVYVDANKLRNLTVGEGKKARPLEEGEIRQYMDKVNNGTLDPVAGKPHPGMITYVKDHAPHFMPDASVLNKHAVEFANDAVKRGTYKNLDEAIEDLHGWIDAKEEGKPSGRTLKSAERLVRTGQAKNVEDALGKMQRFFKASRNLDYGPLIFNREIEFPFYNSDLKDVMTTHAWGWRKHEAFRDVFGSEETLTEKIGKMRLQGGVDVATVNKIVDETLGKIQQLDSSKRWMGVVRNLNALKLTFSPISNLSQSLNTLLASDLKSTLRGIQLAFTDEGRRRALEAGVTLNQILDQSMQKFGLDSEFSRKYMRFVGMTSTEVFNRTVAANAGMEYASTLANKLLKKPTDEVLRDKLIELGVDPENILEKGKISYDELRSAGYNFTKKTQFLSSPLDLPLFFQSPEGKLLMQFKSFAYQQTRFLKNEFANAMRRGDTKGIVKDMLVLSVIFPMGGEVVSDIRSLVTGRAKTTKALDNYFNDLATVGGFGVISDLATAAGTHSLAQTMLGPTLGTVAEGGERVADIAKRMQQAGNEPLIPPPGYTGTSAVSASDVRFFFRQTGLGQTMANYLYPTSQKDQSQFLDTLKQYLGG